MKYVASKSLDCLNSRDEDKLMASFLISALQVVQYQAGVETARY